MAQLFKNNATTTLAATKPAGATSMLVQPGTGANFPALGAGDFFDLTLYKIIDGLETSFEIVKVTARSVDTFTIQGAQDGTPPTTFGVGDQVSMRLPAGWLNGVEASNKSRDDSISAQGVTLASHTSTLATQSAAINANATGLSTLNTKVTSVETKNNAMYDNIYRPTSQVKKIVVFGSSVAFGQGATNYVGWASRLSAAMTARGYTMINKSVSGDTTTALINRFYTDVVPENPSIVIIGLSLANEGLIAGNKANVYTQYLTNMRRLVAMCRARGYQVVVTGVYSNNDYTAADYPFLLQADQELEQSDIPYVNFLGAVDDGTGKWRTGMWADAGHPNDVGHEALFRAFPLSLFDNLSTGRNSAIQAVNQNIMKIDAMANSQVPLVYTSESPFGSFTFMVRIRRTSTAPGGKPLVALESSTDAYQAFRIRNQVDALAVSADATDIIASDVLTSTGKELCLILSFDYFTNMWRFWIDGVLIGSAVYAPAQAINYDQIAFGGRTNFGGFNVNGYEYSDMAVWRAALTAEQVADATAGRITKASLNMYAPVVDTLVPLNSRVVNLAPSSTYGRVLADGITTYPRNVGTSVPKSSTLVRTQDNGYVDPAIIDPSKGLMSNIVEVRGPTNDTNASSYLLPSAAAGAAGAAVDVESLRLGIAGQSGVTFSGQWSTYLSAGAGSTFKEGFKYSMKAKDTSSGTLSATLFSVSGRGVVYMPWLKAGTADVSSRHDLKKTGAQGIEILQVGREGSAQPCLGVNGSDGLGGWSGAASVLYVGKNATTGRAFTSPGTLNAQGTDYAEYFTKSQFCGAVAAGQIVGVNNKNEITDIWVDAVSFAVKSTDPSFVGGDNWCLHLGARPSATAGDEPQAPVRVPGDTDTDWGTKVVAHHDAMTEWNRVVEADRAIQADFDAKLELARARVDRIAIAGRVPVNVMGAQPGDYIVPVQDGAGIKGVAVRESDVTWTEYRRAVGRVITIELDGRAYVMVKTV